MTESPSGVRLLLAKCFGDTKAAHLLQPPIRRERWVRVKAGWVVDLILFALAFTLGALIF